MADNSNNRKNIGGRVSATIAVAAVRVSLE
jgi:hypothetical protein